MMSKTATVCNESQSPVIHAIKHVRTTSSSVVLTVNWQLKCVHVLKYANKGFLIWAQVMAFIFRHKCKFVTRGCRVSKRLNVSFCASMRQSWRTPSRRNWSAALASLNVISRWYRPFFDSNVEKGTFVRANVSLPFLFLTESATTEPLKINE